MLIIFIKILSSGKPFILGILANSEDPDEMLQNALFAKRKS